MRSRFASRSLSRIEQTGSSYRDKLDFCSRQPTGREPALTELHMMPLISLQAREFVPGADAVRSFTAKLHCEVERTLALPGSIQTMADYRRWLIRFFWICKP